MQPPPPPQQQQQQLDDLISIAVIISDPQAPVVLARALVSSILPT
jgi:hypothetical protein